MKKRHPLPELVRSQRGSALIVAIMALLIATLLGSWLMFAARQDTRVSMAHQTQSHSLEIAEAGVEEAIQRMANGEVPSDVSVPQAVTQIYLASAGSLPAVGADTTALPTAQGLSTALPYTTAGKTADVLTIAFKRSPDGTKVMRYSPTYSPQINTLTGAPIYQIRSTGKAGGAAQTVMAEVCKLPAGASVQAAVMADVNITFSGNIHVCGHDHSANTPTGTMPPACNAGIGNWLGPTAHGSCVYGGWSTGTISTGGSSDIQGEPTDTTSRRTGFYVGPWECVGLSQTDYWSWMGTRLGAEPSPPNGIIYLDNDNTKQNQSGNFAYHGGDGEGFLYVDGDLTINGNFTYRGLIYVEGDLQINGTTWVLGALVVKGKTTIKLANGNATVLYSGEAISNAMQKYSKKLNRIAWRQLPR